MLDYSIKYRAVRKMLDDMLSTLDRTSDFSKLYELSNRVSAKLELMDEMDRMDPPPMLCGGAVLDKGPGKGKLELVDPIKADDAPVVSRNPLDSMPADFPPPRPRK
jgi:hypothetical protein